MISPRNPILCFCGYFLAAGVAVAEGTVLFRNRITSQIDYLDVPFFDERGILLEGPSYVAQLYYWRGAEGFRAAGSPVVFATNGYFFGGTVLLPGVGETASAWVQVRAWLVEGGGSFEAAALAGVWTGVSGVLFLPITGCPFCAPPLGPARLSGLEYPGSPLVVRQPQSQAVLAGDRATLSVIASSGVLMDYQWYQQPSNRPDGVIPDATNATYTSAALLTNATFWVSVTNSAGSVLSDKATVTVLPSAPQLSLEQAAGLPVLTIAGVVGVTYRIEYSTNLSATSWTSLVELSMSASPFTFTDSTGSNSLARFYRAVAP